MKKLATMILALTSVVVLGALIAAPAFATQFWLETFPYANGDLTVTGAVNWVVYSGTTPTDIQVTGGAAVGNNLNAPDDHRTFPARTVTQKTYACFQTTINNPIAPTAIVSGYFAELKDGGSSVLVARTYAQPIVGDAAHFNFAISLSSATSQAFLGVHPTVCSFGTKYNLVILYDPNGTGSAKIWVNPANEASTSAVSTTTSASSGVNVISAFGLRQSASSAPVSVANTVKWGYTVDNIGVGDTFADACAGTTTSAATSTWGHLRTTYR